MVYSIQGSEGLILDLSLVVYFLSPAPLFPPQRLPRVIPIKIAVMEKLEARGGRREERRDGSLSYIFPLPIVPRALSFPLSPASLRHKEAFAEERACTAFLIVAFILVVFKWPRVAVVSPVLQKKTNFKQFS